jgi:hypothetical protein
VLQGPELRDYIWSVLIDVGQEKCPELNINK